MTGWQDKYGTYYLPTGWHEVTVRQFCDLAKQPTPTREGAASLFAGRPIQVNGLVADALAFLNTEPPDRGRAAVPQKLGPGNVLAGRVDSQGREHG